MMWQYKILFSSGAGGMLEQHHIGALHEELTLMHGTCTTMLPSLLDVLRQQSLWLQAMVEVANAEELSSKP